MMNLISIVASLCLVLALVSAASRISRDTCQRPNDDQLSAQWAEHIRKQALGDQPESFYSIEKYQQSIADDLAADTTTQHLGIIYGDQDPSHCTISHIEGKDSVRDRSNCPWFNIITNDTNSFPQFVAQARCRCSYGAGMGTATECKEVHYNIRVLRRTEECGEDGLYVYTPGWQSVSVGCTMVKALEVV